MRNRVDHLCNFAIAQALRLFRHPFKRFREGFFLKVKNSNFTIERRIRHSRLLLPLDLGDWIQYWIFMDGAYELELVDFLRPYVQGKVFLTSGQMSVITRSPLRKMQQRFLVLRHRHQMQIY